MSGCERRERQQANKASQRREASQSTHGKQPDMDKVQALKELVENIAKDSDKFFNKNNKAAGVRARKSLQEVKKLAQELRQSIQEAKQEEAAAKRNAAAAEQEQTAF
eukprot:CAMPEP_0198727396 /NCGR_PEP_ID=MMETSP1475-20131203/4132_1 /TAXON_ID= ORGANISM="Unidentified sp., Strain CCMP1999" /NCGR_SAMPLE_ID=MMETSP1475 /ASSEMBLY_ACC=CAM_ASM_001111 /LENGTH=106 /DNA_ID=CAMNT_0044489431 /DNA_START=14 /DNA_END=334 /DNA_ORIENTATION=+